MIILTGIDNNIFACRSSDVKYVVEKWGKLRVGCEKTKYTHITFKDDAELNITTTVSEVIKAMDEDDD